MSSDYLDFDIAIVKEPSGYRAQVTSSPVGPAEAPFVLPFEAAELAQFMIAVGPPRVTSRRLVPVAARLPGVEDYGTRLGDALLSGAVGEAFRRSLEKAGSDNLRVRLRLDDAPELEPIPWEYLYDKELARFLTLSSATPVVRLVDAVERPGAIMVEPPLRVLVMISSPSDLPELAVDREEQLLRATTADLVGRGSIELVVLKGPAATLHGLQEALLDPFHVFHFIGHGAFDTADQQGVLALERPDGTAHPVDGGRLGTLLHDAKDLQLAVLNACEGARTSGRDAFSGVAQALVRQGLPAVVAMQTEISDRAALVFTHEFYSFLTRGLPIDAAICEVRKAMAISDEAAEWGTAVLLRSDADQPFTFPAAATSPAARPQPEERWSALYQGAQGALAAASADAALPMLEQLAVEHPDYADVTQLLERIRPALSAKGDATANPPAAAGQNAAKSAAELAAEIAAVKAAHAATQATGEGAQATGAGGATRPTPTNQPLTAPTALAGTGHLDDLVDVHDEPVIEVRHRPSKGPWVLVGAGAVLAALVTAFVLIRNPSVTPPVIPPTQTSQVARTTAVTAATIEKACGPAAGIPVIAGALTAGCAVTAPVVDGSFNEWAAVPSTTIRAVVFRAQGDTSKPPVATWRTTWDRDALYVQASVADAVRRDVNEADPAQFWRGDAISFEFGPDARSLGTDAGLRNGRDRHVMIGISGDLALGSMNVARGNDFPGDGAVPGITAAVRRTVDGYDVEAKVPWSVLGLNRAPARGSVFAANFNISDAKPIATWQLGVMVSSNPERTVQRRPAIWQDLVLADPS